MSEIRIHREHDLGLAKAREIAWRWAEEAEQKFGMACTVIEGEFGDTVEFTRSGVHGQLIVAPDHFDLQAKLGFLLGAFSKTIETQILKNLDDLLGRGEAEKHAADAAAARKGNTATKSNNSKVAAKKSAPRRKA